MIEAAPPRAPMLRILHVTPYSPRAWAYGGIPRVVGAQCDELTRRGHEVTICTTDAASADARLLRPDGAATRQPWTEQLGARHELRVFPNLSNRLAYHWQLFLPIGMTRYLAEHARDFDVAHLHACHNLPGVIASRALTRARIPYVVQPNGTAPRIERRLIAKWLFDMLAGDRVLESAARVVAVSGAERRQLQALGVASERIRLVPNPVDMSEFDPPIERGRFRPRWRLDTGRIVMFLGKLTPRKRLDVLARAFAKSAAEDTRLVVVGNDMGYGRELRRLLNRLGIAGRTTFTGLVAGRARLEALADADVVVYASKDEIFGLVPVEAILSGTPVIVADDSGCGEVIGEVGGGIVVREGDVDALAGAISTVLGAPNLWRQRAAEAQARIRSRYGAAVVADALERVYVEAANREDRAAEQGRRIVSAGGG